MNEFAFKDVQVNGDNSDTIYEMSWDEVFARLHNITPSKLCTIYGVPRGGTIVAGLMLARNGHMKTTTDEREANIIVDDIIDSGKTRADFVEHGFKGEFVALVDKTKGEFPGVWVRFPWEYSSIIHDCRDTVVRQLQMIGEDPNRAGLKETPRRYLSALMEMCSGLGTDAAAPLGTTFQETHDEIVVVRGIKFTSLCEHHLLPFVGTVDFAYLPQGKIVGLSKIPRFIRNLASRPQVQERLTSQIADTFMQTVEPLGVAVIVKGSHSCMRLRGVRDDGEMITSVMRGVFKDKAEARAEVLALFEKR